MADFEEINIDNNINSIDSKKSILKMPTRSVKKIKIKNIGNAKTWRK